MPATPAPQVLEQIEASLTETLRQTEERGRAFPDSANSGRDAAWAATLLRLGDRLAALDDCVSRAGRAVAEADEALAAAAEDIHRWLAAARGARYDKSSTT
jgi:hypothetical protein